MNIFNPEHSALVARTLRTLEDTFAHRGHDPSPTQWAALVDLVKAYDAMATGKAPKRVMLSSLDPGIGKTSTLKAYLHHLLGGPAMQDCGVLIAMFTLDEINRFVSEVAIPDDMLAVWTSDKNLNALGRADIENAQVLITTHARVENELDGQEFWSASSLYFKGQPRRLKVWDEAFMPSRPLTLSVDDVMSALKVLRMVSQDVRNAVKKVFDRIEELEDGEVVTVPDFLHDNEVSANDLLAAAHAYRPRNENDKAMQDAMVSLLSDLALVSGRRVRVFRDGRYGNTTIDFVDTLPEDIAPVVVLDASGRVRHTYSDMERERQTLVRLKSAPKSYRNLTVHLWKRGGGKSSWKGRQEQEELAAGIVKTVMTKPTEDWLVIHHKPAKGVFDLQARLKRVLKPAVFSKVKFISWGKHKATNEAEHIPNIILAGTLFLRPSQYAATKHAASGVPVHVKRYSKQELETFQMGEHASDILQGLCRGKVRKSLGDTCPPCDAYVIAADRTGIPGALPHIFPDVKLVQWNPLPPTLKRLQKRAFNVLDKWSKTAAPGDVFTFKELSQELNVTTRQLKDDVRRSVSFNEALASIGLSEWGPNVYFTGYRKA